MKYFRTLFISIMCLLFATSCDRPNALTKFSQTETDDALYIDAKKYIDNYQWTEAIDLMNGSLSAGFKTRADVRKTMASAYAGRCGLDFLSLVNNLGSSSSSLVFNFFMMAMRGRVVSPTDCDTAQSIMETFGATPAERTSEQNLFIVILGIAKSGAYLRDKADQDSAGIGDGQRDGGFDVCDDTSLPDANVVGAMVGFGLVMQNISSIAGQLGGGTAADITGLQDTCDTAMSVFLGTPTVCDFTDQEFITDNVTYFRSLLNDADTLGIGSCNGDPLFRGCPCDGI